MVISDEKHEEVFLHAMGLMKDNADGSGEIYKTLKHNDISDIIGIFVLKWTEIEDLKYKVSNKGFSLSRGQKSMLCILSAYNTKNIRAGTPLKVTDWLTVTQDIFDDFRMIYKPDDYFASEPAPGSASTKPPSKLGTASSNFHDPVRDFKRGIKRDPSLFPILKDTKQWDPWFIDTKAQARAQDVEDILNPKYKPATQESKGVFDQKQKYMYAVFTKTLLTDKGKSLVREHEDEYNAQLVYSKLVDHAQRSTKASVESSQLLTYITSTRLGTGSWKGSCHSFILHWQNQIRKYEQLVPSADCFSDSIKRTMLENAVSSIQDLRAVKDQANQLQVRLGSAMKYDDYCSLLLSAALTYDSQIVTNTNSRGARRSVYNHGIQGDRESAFNIDSDLQFLELQEHNNDATLELNYTQASQRPRLNYKQWQQLSHDARNTWNLLDTESKTVILGHKTSQHRQANNTNVRLSTEIEPHTEPGGADHTNINEHGETVDGSLFHDSLTEQPSEVATRGDNAILAHVTQRTDLPPGHLNRFLSSPSPPPNTRHNVGRPPPRRPNTNNEIVLDGKRYRQVNVSNILYHHSHDTSKRGALVDRGANGGICGNDVRIISKTGRSVDVQGIDNHQITDIPIVTAGAVVKTQRGPIVVIMNQYAHIGHGKTIHSCGQMEMFGQDVNDKSMKVPGGLQRIATQDGYCIPLNIKSGLPYMSMRPYTDDDWDNLPHLILTSDADWDPSVLDNTIDDDEIWFDAMSDLPDDSVSPLFDLCGNYRHRHAIHFHDISRSDLGDGVLPNEAHLYKTFESDTKPGARETLPKEPDYTSFIPNLGWSSLNAIKRTFAATTQYVRIPMSTHLTRHFKSPFPALNIHRRQEAVATDTVYSDTPAIDCGDTEAQFYCGVDSLVCDAYGMKTDKQFVNTFEDIIRQRGAMDKLISDGAKVETSGRAKDIFRAYVIGNWHSEAYQQQQNYAERKYQQVKTVTNRIMERAGSPAYTWLLALLYVCFLLNHVATESLSWRTPLERLTGVTPDISPLLRFHWYQPVYYMTTDP